MCSFKFRTGDRRGHEKPHADSTQEPLETGHADAAAAEAEARAWWRAEERRAQERQRSLARSSCATAVARREPCRPRQLAGAAARVEPPLPPRVPCDASRL